MRVLLVGVAASILATPAAAQTAAQAPEALDRVYACAAVSDEDQRLACYDAAVGRLREAQTSGQIVAVDRQQAVEIEREAFGFSLPSMPRLFGREAAEDRVETMQLVVERVSSRGEGLASFVMTNGQVWQQISPGQTRLIRAGTAVTIRRAALGSYMLTIDSGGQPVRVRRAE